LQANFCTDYARQPTNRGFSLTEDPAHPKMAGPSNAPSQPDILPKTLPNGCFPPENLLAFCTAHRDLQWLPVAALLKPVGSGSGH
jgi:hypothetical protein